MNSFNKSFNQAFNPAFQQGAAAYQTAQRDKMQEEIQKQAQATQRNQQIIDEAAKVGANPVMNPDGSLNAAATYALISKTQAQQDKIKKTAEREDAYNFDLSKKASALGVGAKPTQTQQPSGGLPQYLAKPGVAPMAQPAEEPLERQVFTAEQEAKKKQIAEETKARGEANAPFGQRYESGDRFAVNGKYAGTATFDKNTGNYGLRQADGSIVPMPDGAEPITPTALQKAVPSIDSFRKFKTELTDAERSLTQIERYAKEVGGLNQGLAGLADKFSAGIKTLLGTGKLTQAELSRRLAEGNLQGLLGGNRLAVVGGGVMTEQDAQRIIDYLGGDVNAWQNKEQVMEALGQLYQDRRAQYDDNLKFYNMSVDAFYGSQGYDKAKFKDYSPLFQPQETPAAAPQGLNETEQARLQELRAKLNQQ